MKTPVRNLSVNEASEALGVSIRSVHRMLADGRLPRAPIGMRRTLIPESAISALTSDQLDRPMQRKAGA